MGEIILKLLLIVAALAIPATANAKDIAIKMLNRGTAGMMVFEPAAVTIAPGDTVTFEPTQPSHNAESITTMMPAGATPFKGKINERLTVKFSKPGVYGVKCLPHYAMGMVALVRVGNPSANLVQARAEVAKLPLMAKRRLEPLLAATK